MPTSAPTWPSTILVRAFYLVYAAIPNILKGMCMSLVVTLRIFFSGAIALAAWWMIAWLYGLPSPNKKGNNAGKKMVGHWACCNTFIFSSAFCLLDLRDEKNKGGTSLLVIGFEAGCVVLELCLLVVAIAAVVKMALKVADERGAGAFLEELRKGQDASREAAAAANKLSSGDSDAGIDRLASKPQDGDLRSSMPAPVTQLDGSED